MTATVDTQTAVAQSVAVVIVVPLVVDTEATPDFTAMDAATRAVGSGLRDGTLVSFETTVPVGTTRTRLAPLLAQVSSLVPERDFHVVFSPERVLTGRVFNDLRRYPKLVGGLSPAGERAGCAFYESVLDFNPRSDLPRPNGVWAMGSAEAAELAKLAETTYRDVNIALANQFAVFAESAGIDVHRVIEACNSQPYSHIHQPGIAVGGHCIPVYPRLYLWNDPTATVVQAARMANAEMPNRAIQRLEGFMGPLSGLNVTILGAAYRGGVKETAFSGVWDLVQLLHDRGAQVFVHDPLYKDAELAAMGLAAFHRGDRTDAVILHTDHAEYREWRSSDTPGARVIVDGRRILEAQHWPGVKLLTIGTAD